MGASGDGHTTDWDLSWWGSTCDELSAFGISIDPNTNYVYVGTNCGLAISENAGHTWRFVDPTPATPADDVWDVVVHDGIIDLIGDDGDQRSIDGGSSWTSGALPGRLGSIDASPHEPDVLFATTGAGRDWPSGNPTTAGRLGRN